MPTADNRRELPRVAHDGRRRPDAPLSKGPASTPGRSRRTGREPARQAATRPNDPVWHRDVGEPAPDTTTQRLFVALKLPAAAIEEIGSFINAMPTMAAQNVRWIPRENVHLTLMFLGDTATERLPDLKQQLSVAASNTSPFSLKLGETGAFPAYHSPKILWVGLDGEVRKLMQLQGRIEGALRLIGFEPERRAFKPHVTVGRTVRDLIRQYAGDVGFSWRRSPIPEARTEIPVTELHLLQSRLQTGGAVYSSVFSVQLGS